MINLFRSKAPVVPEKPVPDTTRICDFPEARKITGYINGIDRYWYLIEGQPGIYDKSSSYFHEIRARYGSEVYWFRRAKRDEKSIAELAAIIAKTMPQENVA